MANVNNTSPAPLVSGQHNPTMHQNRVNFHPQQQGNIQTPWALIGSIAAAGIGALSQYYSNRKQEEIARQQNEYNERMIDKMNTYNDPAQQIQRLVQAGYTLAQAKSMLYGSPSSAVGTQTESPTATPYDYQSPLGAFADVPNTAANLLGALDSHAESALDISNKQQDLIRRQIENKYIDDTLRENLNHIQSINVGTDLDNVVKGVTSRIATLAESEQTKATIAQFTATYMSLSGYCSMSPAEQEKYTQHLMQNLLHEEETHGRRLESEDAQLASDKSMYHFLKDMWDFKKKHSKTFQSRDLDEALFDIDNYKTSKQRNEWERKNLSWQLRNESRYQQVWDAELNARQWGAEYNAEMANQMKAGRKELVKVYLDSIYTNWQAQKYYNVYMGNFYDKAKHFNLDEPFWKEIRNNINWVLGWNSSSVNPNTNLFFPSQSNATKP